jgi:hypothetical protein
MNWFLSTLLIALIPTALAVIGVNVVWKFVGAASDKRHDATPTSRAH